MLSDAGTARRYVLFTLHKVVPRSCRKTATPKEICDSVVVDPAATTAVECSQQASGAVRAWDHHNKAMYFFQSEDDYDAYYEGQAST